MCNLCCDDPPNTGETERWTTRLALIPLIGGVVLSTQVDWARRLAYSEQLALCLAPSLFITLVFAIAMQRSWQVQEEDHFEPLEAGRVRFWTLRQMRCWCCQRTFYFVMGMIVWLGASCAILF